jgi:hypothetical protein
MLMTFVLLLAIAVPSTQSVGDRVNALLTEFRAIQALDRDARQVERLEALAIELENVVRLERRRAPSPIAPTLDFLDQRLFVRAELLARRRASSGEPLIEHAQFLLWAERELNPNATNLGPLQDPRAALTDNVEGRRALRAKYGRVFVDAAIELSRAFVVLGRNAEALDTLQQAERRMHDIPDAIEQIRAEIKRVPGFLARQGVFTVDM